MVYWANLKPMHHDGWYLSRTHDAEQAWTNSDHNILGWAKSPESGAIPEIWHASLSFGAKRKPTLSSMSYVKYLENKVNSLKEENEFLTAALEQAETEDTSVKGSIKGTTKGAIDFRLAVNKRALISVCRERRNEHFRADPDMDIDIDIDMDRVGWLYRFRNKICIDIDDVSTSKSILPRSIDFCNVLKARYAVSTWGQLGVCSISSHPSAECWYLELGERIF